MRTEYKDGIATITTATRKTEINVKLTAELALKGDLGRPSASDAKALAAGYLHHALLVPAREEHAERKAGLSSALAAPYGAPARTDEEIVRQTEELAEALATNDGWEPAQLDGVTFHSSESPRARRYWKMACDAQSILTNTDPEDALSNLENPK